MKLQEALPHTFPEILRELAQRKRNGTLTCKSGNNYWRLFFLQGKIVDGEGPTSSAIEALTYRLIRAEVIAPQEGGIEADTYEDLFREVDKICTAERRPLCSEDRFRELLRHQLLDLLYELDPQSGVFSKGFEYSFDTELHTVSERFSPTIGVGQLILDWSALSEFDPVSKGITTPHQLITLGNTQGRELPLLLPDEELLFRIVESNERIALSSLASLSALSAYALYESLFSLLDQGYLEVFQELQALEETSLSKESIEAQQEASEEASHSNYSLTPWEKTLVFLQSPAGGDTLYWILFLCYLGIPVLLWSRYLKTF